MAELFSREAEQAVLGGLFVSPVAFSEVAALVTSLDFADSQHRLIFSAMAALAARNEPIDLVTVGDYMEAAKQLPNPQDFAYLLLLARDTPSAANVLAYAGIVRGYAMRRRIVALADRMANWAREDRDPGQTISKLREELDAIDRNETLLGLRPLAAILPNVLADLDDRAHRTKALLGLHTGLGDLDRILDGLCAGRLYVVAGRPSSGKSVLGLQFAREAVRDGKCVALFSLEMPETEVVHRLLSSEIPLDLNRISSARMQESEWEALTHTALRLDPATLWIDDSSSLNVRVLQARARRLHRQSPLGLVVVDYIGLLDGERTDNRVLEIGGITRALKQLAKELDCPVVALAQLNRKLEERVDKRPVLSDLRESGSVEQDADVVLMVYRDDLYRDDSPDKGCAELLIRKHRGGRTGMVPTLFRGEHCTFLPLAGPLPSQDHADDQAPRRRGFKPMAEA